MVKCGRLAGKTIAYAVYAAGIAGINGVYLFYSFDDPDPLSLTLSAAVAIITAISLARTEIIGFMGKGPSSTTVIVPCALAISPIVFLLPAPRSVVNLAYYAFAIFASCLIQRAENGNPAHDHRGSPGEEETG